MAADELQLITNGQAFGGWKSIAVRRSMEHCSGAFVLGVSWRRGVVAGARRIQEGEPCEVRLGEEHALTGYVDQVADDIGDRVHEVTVCGRDKTADLVDCAAGQRSGQWRGQKIEQIAADLARPFSINVLAEVDTGAALPSFALQQGETVFEAIDRAARIRALLLTSNAKGELVITRAGQRRAPGALVLGDNLLHLHASRDLRDRYSEYRALGQAPGSDTLSGSAVSQITAKAVDPGVRRYRPMVIVNDAPDLASSLRQRVQWEANVRAARSLDIQARVQGWRIGGRLWAPNEIVPVSAAAVGLEAELLITQVEFTADEGGTTTTLSLTRPDAFTLLPLKAAAAPESWWSDAKAGAR